MLDGVPTRGKRTQIEFSITYLWKVAMDTSTCTLEHTSWHVKAASGGSGRFAGIVGNAGNHGNYKKFH